MTLSTWAAKTINTYVENMNTHFSAIVDYLTGAVMQEPDYKGNMPWDREIHYDLNNRLNGLWNAMFGNTTNTVGLDTSVEKMPRDLAWKPVHIKARADSALAAYIQAKPACDERSERFDPDYAAQDQTFLDLSAKAEHAQRLFDYFNTEFIAKLELYQTLYEETWTYKPYEARTERLAREMTPAQKAQAEKFRAMKNRNAA